jgi:hypothetical protein
MDAKKKSKAFSKLVITCGMVGLMMFAGPIVQNNPMGTFLNTIEAQAAEAYSPRWSIDANGTWSYNLDSGGKAVNAWIQDEVSGDWYLLDNNGDMRTGVFKSNGGKYYLLDTVRGTGHYGKLLKNGEVYQGITIQADTSAAYEGALSSETISALQNIGVDFGAAPSVENTQHVSNGKVTSETESKSNNVTEDSIAQNSNETKYEVSAEEEAELNKLRLHGPDGMYGGLGSK